MRILIQNITENPTSLLRRAGYVFQHTDGDEISFVRVLAKAGYPRFHCYVKLSKLDVTVSVHLDQKKHTYGDTTRHHGEYENSPPLTEEGHRLLSVFGKNARIL